MRPLKLNPATTNYIRPAVCEVHEIRREKKEPNQNLLNMVVCHGAG